MKNRPEPIIDKLIKRAELLDCNAGVRFHMPGNALAGYVPPPPSTVCPHCKMIETLNRLKREGYR